MQLQFLLWVIYHCYNGLYVKFKRCENDGFLICQIHPFYKYNHPKKSNILILQCLPILNFEYIEDEKQGQRFIIIMIEI